MNDGHGDGHEDKGPQDRGHWPEPVAEREVEAGEGGKTANQIISASRCLVGGPAGFAVVVFDMSAAPW
jgi:hypothetical protein